MAFYRENSKSKSESNGMTNLYVCVNSYPHIGSGIKNADIGLYLPKGCYVRVLNTHDDDVNLASVYASNGQTIESNTFTQLTSDAFVGAHYIDVSIANSYNRSRIYISFDGVDSNYVKIGDFPDVPGVEPRPYTQLKINNT